MTKAAVFVVSCSIVILVLFGVFCFLMSIVNPPPLKVEEKVSNETETKKPLQKSANETEANLSSFYLRNMNPSDDVEYGLEKTYDSSNLRASSGPSLNRMNITHPLPTLKRKNPYIVKVYPPIWPPSMRSTTLRRTHQILTETTISKTTNTKVTTNVLKNLTNITTIPVTTAKPESPIHRRSINVFEKSVNTETGSVILKILDDDGQSRIEIKLSPNDIFETKKSRIYRSSVKTDSKFSMAIEGADENVDIRELPHNTDIKILPNRTVVIENENHDLRPTKVEFTIKTNSTHEISTSKYVDRKATGFTTELKAITVPSLHEDNKTKKLDSRQRQQGEKSNIVQNTTPIPNLKGKMPSNTTMTELFGIKARFDNITRSFTELYHIDVSENKTN